MTTIISRLYQDAATAETIAGALMDEGHTPDRIAIFTAPDEAAITATWVGPAAAKAYATALGQGGALVVATVGFGRTTTAIGIMDSADSLDVGLATESRYMSDFTSSRGSDSVLKSHPLWMTNRHASLPHSRIFGAANLSKHRTSRSAIAGGRLMAKYFWPMPHVIAPGKRNSAKAR